MRFRRALFKRGLHRLHSGSESWFFIDCDALAEYDWQTIALLVSEKIKFSKVVGIPTGGIKFAEALRPYAQPGYPTLIVDDVLTTGSSMEQARLQYPDAVGVVLFARRDFPNWIIPVFRLNPKWEEL